MLARTPSKCLEAGCVLRKWKLIKAKILENENKKFRYLVHVVVKKCKNQAQIFRYDLPKRAQTCRKFINFCTSQFE